LVDIIQAMDFGSIQDLATFLIALSFMLLADQTILILGIYYSTAENVKVD